MRTLIRTSMLFFVVSLLASASASASELFGPGWEITGRTYPTNLAPGARGLIVLDPFNIGETESNGAITVTDSLPPGVSAREVVVEGETRSGAGELESRVRPERPRIGNELWSCTGNAEGPAPHVEGATVIACTNTPALAHIAGGGGHPNEEGPEHEPYLGIAVSVAPSATEAVREGAEANRVTIAGGGAPTPVSIREPVTISSKQPAFGVADWQGWASSPNGTLDTQAGSHPYDLTFSLDLATAIEGGVGSGGSVQPVGNARNFEAELPPGFVGDPTAAAECTAAQLNAYTCPNASQVGTLTVEFATFPPQLTRRVFNMVPPPGVPAEFATTIEGVTTLFDTSLRSGGDYGITTNIANVPELEIVGSILTLWGVPGDPSHDPWRSSNNEGGCTREEIAHSERGCISSGTFGGNEYGVLGASLAPFLTLPTSCGGPLAYAIRATSWEGATAAPASFLSRDSNYEPVGVTGCEDLAFGPTLTVAPDTARADTPTGLTVEVKPPVGGIASTEGLSSSDIQDTTVTLPEGLVINPGQAAGLQACQPAQAHVGDGRDDASECPNASKVGEVEIETPLLPHSLKGNVYILQSNPPKLELLIAASGEGVNLKLVGDVHLDEATGRLTATFSETPELPFTNFKLSFSGGAQAALDTPTQCGIYGTAADFTPWSKPFLAGFTTGANFATTEGAGGAACPASPLPFAPTMTAGSTTDQAGGFTNFSLLLQRGDDQQRIERLAFTAPQGLSGLISHVSLCDEADANAGTCPAASHIGHAVVSSGPGPYPLVLPQPGEPELPIYLTGSYDGAPFGLSIVTPVLAGPFNLGTIVTRARIEVDPHTAQITITTNPLPQTVAGVPTDLRSIDAVIDRPTFMINPTNCSPQSFSGTATSAQGATAPISSPFGMGSCRSLEFKPQFSVSTTAHPSREGGASLTAKLSYPAAAQGTQANIARVKVELPKQLPSRLTTLQKACTAAQFDTNPAGCPPASKIGYATVHTSLLPVPVSGPAIFVSHGGEAFPSLTMVLQGDGVTVDLVGTTYISRAGITSTTFKTVPDVPFSTFELTLPQGKYSALAANLPGNAKNGFCGQRLSMPTEFLAQNGLKIDETTKVTVSGCSKARRATRHKHKHGRRGKKKK